MQAIFGASVRVMAARDEQGACRRPAAAADHHQHWVRRPELGFVGCNMIIDLHLAATEPLTLGNFATSRVQRALASLQQ